MEKGYLKGDLNNFESCDYDKVLDFILENNSNIFLCLDNLHIEYKNLFEINNFIYFESKRIAEGISNGSIIIRKNTLSDTRANFLKSNPNLSSLKKDEFEKLFKEVLETLLLTIHNILKNIELEINSIINDEIIDILVNKINSLSKTSSNIGVLIIELINIEIKKKDIKINRDQYYNIFFKLEERFSGNPSMIKEINLTKNTFKIFSVIFRFRDKFKYYLNFKK